MNITDSLYEKLKGIIPTLPKNPTKIILVLEVDKVPTIEVTSYIFESEILHPETETKTFELKEVELDIVATTSPRDWSEDFKHENGNYQNKCVNCEKWFIGHKRRIVCKVCDNDKRS